MKLKMITRKIVKGIEEVDFKVPIYKAYDSKKESMIKIDIEYYETSPDTPKFLVMMEVESCLIRKTYLYINKNREVERTDNSYDILAYMREYSIKVTKEEFESFLDKTIKEL